MNTIRNIIQGIAVMGVGYIVVGDFCLKFCLFAVLSTIIIVTIELAPKEH